MYILVVYPFTNLPCIAAYLETAFILMLRFNTELKRVFCLKGAWKPAGNKWVLLHPDKQQLKCNNKITT